MPKPRYLPTRAGRPPAARSGDRRLDDDRHREPDPAIFDPALEALGTARDRTLYVGDTVHADVLGAGRAGLPVVQLDPLDLHIDHDHWRLPDLDALARHLGA